MPTTVPGSTGATNIINKVQVTLVDMAAYDMHRALGFRAPRHKLKRTSVLQGGSHAIGGVFILGCCLIEAAGHFMLGPGPDTTHGSGASFKAFARKYLNMYDADRLYHSMRCGLAHAYSTTGDKGVNVNRSYDLTHRLPSGIVPPDDIAGAHVTYVNAVDFVLDIEEGVEQFLRDVRANTNNEQTTFLDWAEVRGFMTADTTVDLQQRISNLEIEINAATTTPNSQDVRDAVSRLQTGATIGTPATPIIFRLPRIPGTFQNLSDNFSLFSIGASAQTVADNGDQKMTSGAFQCSIVPTATVPQQANTGFRSPINKNSKKK